MYRTAYKLLNRRLNPSPEEALASGLFAAADLCGLPFASFRRWRADPATPAWRAAEESSRELAGRLCALGGLKEEEGPPIELPLRRLREAVSRYRPGGEVSGPRPGARAADLEFFLRLLFGKTAFRPGQREAVVGLLEGRDALFSLPTGGGKSIVFQLAAMLLPGTCLVVEPTVSLIEDQILGLRRSGLERAAAGEEAFELPGGADFCYLVPELLRAARFRRVLRRLACGEGVSLAVIDEAHCVSEWGHDFRPSYLGLGPLLRELVSSARRPPLAAVTATASPPVLRGAARDLGLAPEAFTAVRGPDRPELDFRVLRCPVSKKRERLLGLLRELVPRGPGIIFCPHAEGPFGARELADFVFQGLGERIEVYTGRPPRGRSREDWEKERRASAAAFKAGGARLLAATKAFGLGIDIPAVRFTVHLALPPSPEAFYQEAGRAGRDGAPAAAWILASIEDVPRARWLLDPRTPVEEVRAELDRTPEEECDDVLRGLELHTRAFRGPAAEREDVLKVVARLGPSGAGPRRLALGGQHGPLAEKALHRLRCLGVVEEYEADGPRGEFLVHRSGKSLDREELDGFLARLYRDVERERRRAMARMAWACRPSAEPGDLRRAVLESLRPGEPTRSEGPRPLPPDPDGLQD